MFKNVKIIYSNTGYIRSFENMKFITAIIKFQVTTAINCKALTCCKNVSYVVGHERAISLLLQCTVYSVGINILIWIYEVYYIKEKVYNRLFVHNIHKRRCLLQALIHHSITCRNGKKYGRKYGELRAEKFM